MANYACRLCDEKGHNKRRCPQGIQLGKPKAPTIRKKHNHDEEQPKSTLCHQPGHNRAGCSSAVANMYADPAASDFAASSSIPPKKKT
ncbi:hypothetical protein AAHA92_06598 [Salvia divinorum]|uniref:CCHC-type domain-containing protein n=1 Tax=Salvia divinorum TaxID=28513 RepID=A0ABD1I665_SALDI